MAFAYTDFDAQLNPIFGAHNMKPISLWTGTKWIAASAIVMATAVGCGSGDEGGAAGEGDNGGVSNSIKSPVMDKNDDKAAAGSDNSTGDAAGNSAVGGTTGGNAATGNAAGNTATKTNSTP
jgi:hypothetical protein